MRHLDLLLRCAALAALLWPAEAGAVERRPEPNTGETAFRLMSLEKEREYRALLPRVEDRDVQRILSDRRLLLYTQKEMPPAYQDWGGGLNGVHSPFYNVSANRREPYGNGNREFPWGAPAGTHRSRNVESFRWMLLPQDEAGKTLPVVWMRSQARHDRGPGYSWRFPVGTRFGEVLTMRSPKGKRIAFELRIRKREAGAWAVNVFRPFPTSKDLVKAITARRPNWRDSTSLTALVTHLKAAGKMKVATLRSRHPGRTVFRQRMGIDELPPIADEALVVALLTETPFRSALGATWRLDSEGLETCAPTTKADFHIIPKNYAAGFVEVDRDSCMRCHETTNVSVRAFHFSRDWYGRVRGADGIFSFHPFALSSISRNGFSRRVRMRRPFIEAGLLERYDPKKHSPGRYPAIAGLR